MRLGLALGFEDSLEMIVDLAGRGEAAGFDSMYVVEAGRSASVPAAAVIGATSDCRVGTYVVNAYAREPWLTGLIARDLDELSGGRFVLGVGTGNKHFNEWYMGADMSGPIAKMPRLRHDRAGGCGRQTRRAGASPGKPAQHPVAGIV